MSQTFFQDYWLNEPIFILWLERVESNNKIARCKLCHKTIELSNMGRRAITSHMKSAKHKEKIEACKKSAPFKCFIKEKSAIISSTNVEKKADDITVASCSSTTNEATCSTVVNDSSNFRGSASLEELTARGIKSFMLKDSVTKAEILWAVESVMTHTSLRTAGRDALLFKTMFPDSDIAKKMQLQRDKVGYLLAYGIAPFFQKELLDIVNKCEFIVVGFDESLNKVAQKQQMDINVRFWDEERREVSTRYLTSVFLGRSRATDLLNAFQDGLKSVDMKKILQISMDGPNVNLKFLKDLKASLNRDPTERKILDLGSCGLHTLHCAFKTSMQETGWNIVPFLRALYNLFKDSPARRALFTSVTNSTVFPKKFCAVRWLQNVEVAQRAIEIMSNLKLFVEEAEKNKSVSSQSFKTVVTALADPLLAAKLEFFRGLASDIEPFLEKFQSDEPLAPFLYSELSSLIKCQISKIVKPGILEKIHSLKDLKIPEKDLLSAGEINIGIATKSAISRANKSAGKIPNSLISEFRENCKKALIKFIGKMLEKSPLNFTLTRAVSCFDPAIAVNSKVRKTRMELLLTLLLDNNWVPSSIVDRIMKEYEDLCQTPKAIAAFKSYDRKLRLDNFWITVGADKSHLYQIVKLVCTLSHGNANVERGFSVNAECIVENMRDELLIARRIVYDTIASIGGIENLEIEKPLIHAARNSYSLSLEAAKLKKKQQEELSQKIKHKREAEISLKELQRKKAKILEDAQKAADLLNEEIKTLSQI